MYVLMLLHFLAVALLDGAIHRCVLELTSFVFFE